MCKNCGHGPDDHGDRAVKACIVPVELPKTTRAGRKYTFKTECNCPGWAKN